MNTGRPSRLSYRLQHITFVVLLITCLGFAGWLSEEFNFRSDWTAGARHSLSKDSIKLLSELKGPIQLRSYQPDDPSLLQAIREILTRYQNYKADFTFNIINPDIYIEQAKSDAIQRYGQSIVEYQGKLERIDTLNEESLTNALMRLHRGTSPKIYFLSQHGERSIQDNSGTGYSLLAQKLQQTGFDVSAINLLQQDIQTSGSVLVLSSISKPLLASELELIQQYLNAGGNFLWLQDPGIDPSQQSLSELLNITFLDGVVVDDNEKISRMLQLSHAAMLPVLEYKLHPVTQDMQYYTLFTTATAIIANTDESEWIHSDLLITSNTSWSETSDLLTDVIFHSDTDIPGPLSLGIALQRQLKDNDRLTAQRIIVIGDSDFASNHNIGHGANLDLILKSFNWLSEDDSLISIAAKDAPDLELNMTPTTASVIALLFFLIIPLGLASTGIVIWLRRRKR